MLKGIVIILMIFIVTIILVTGTKKKKKNKYAKKENRHPFNVKEMWPYSLEHGAHPNTKDMPKTSNCEEFSQNARFSPFSVLNHHENFTDDKWIAFYYWCPHNQPFALLFLAPTNREREYMKQILDPQVAKPINWSARHFIWYDFMNNVTSLVVEQGDRGQYFLYPYERRRNGEKIEPIDIRFKQTGDNKFIGIMFCSLDHVFIMARKKDIPKKARIQEEASRIGYYGRGGKSYLYRGHHWLPIPEADDNTYIVPRENGESYAFDYV